MSALNQIITMCESMALKKPDDKKTLEEQDIIKKISEEQDTVKTTPEEQGTVKKTSEGKDTGENTSTNKGMLSLPNELFLDIGSYLGLLDNGNVSRVNKLLSLPFRESFYKVLASREYILYPRYVSFSKFHSLINGDVFNARHVKKLVLVKDGLVAPRNDYGWYWEELENATGSYFTVTDWDIIRNINGAHERDIYYEGNFLTGGMYRTGLTTVLRQLPNLETIEVRHLNPGEHLPGWAGPELMKELSLYHDGLYDRNMFYGDWKYDEIQKRVTEYVDEFGELITEPGAGPQATFKEDLDAAYRVSGTQAAIIYG